MNPDQKRTLEMMLENLRTAGDDCGFMSDGESVWIRGLGAPWTDTPTLYTKADLDNAINSGKLRAQFMIGSSTWTMFVLPED